jgi:hypothetical protein
LFYLLLKAALSGVVVAIASEVARRWPGWGALIVSLPRVSVLAMSWLWRDTHDPGRLATHAESTFWFVLPSLPMFLLIPWMLRQGAPFWVSLASGCAVTIVLYLAMIGAAPRLGLKL